MVQFILAGATDQQVINLSAKTRIKSKSCYTIHDSSQIQWGACIYSLHQCNSTLHIHMVVSNRPMRWGSDRTLSRKAHTSQKKLRDSTDTFKLVFFQYYFHTQHKLGARFNTQISTANTQHTRPEQHSKCCKREMQPKL